MPLYEYKCAHGHLTTLLRKWQDKPKTTGCHLCGKEARTIVSAPAFTPSGWGDSKWAGRFDKGLGITLRDKKHRDQVMKERGLVEDTVRDQRNRLDSAMSQADEHDRTVARYKTNLDKNNGDKGLAIAETFPVE